MGGRLQRCIGTALLLWLLVAAPAIASVPLPDDARPIMDHAGLLSAPAAARLASRLEALQTAAGRRVSVLTVESTGGVPIDAYVGHLQDFWQVDGDAVPGALLVVAWRERNIGLVETGPERTLDPERLRRIVRDVITPAFRQHAFDRGLEAGIDAVIAELEAGTRRAVDARVSEPRTADLHRPRSAAPSLPMLMAGLACALLVGVLGLRARSGRAGPATAAGSRSWLGAGGA